MTDNELLEILDEIKFTPRLAYNEDFEATILIDKIGSDYEIVEQYGGEGKGDEFWIVCHFAAIDKYIRASAYYSSGDGISDWDDWYVVNKKEKTITVYE
jgi:hypothetical protein